MKVREAHRKRSRKGKYVLQLSVSSSFLVGFWSPRTPWCEPAAGHIFPSLPPIIYAKDLLWKREGTSTRLPLRPPSAYFSGSCRPPHVAETPPLHVARNTRQRCVSQCVSLAMKPHISKTPQSMKVREGIRKRSAKAILSQTA